MFKALSVIGKNVTQSGIKNIRNKTMKSVSNKIKSESKKLDTIVNKTLSAKTEDGAPSTDTAKTGDGAPSTDTAKNEDGAPSTDTAKNEDGAPSTDTAKTGDGAPSTDTAKTGDGAPSTDTAKTGDGAQSNGEGAPEKIKPIDDTKAFDASVIISNIEEKEKQEAAKHPTTFISRITNGLSIITNVLPKLETIKKMLPNIDIPKLLAKLPLPPIPMVIAARAATIVPKVMNVVDQITNPEIIDNAGEYIITKQKKLILQEKKEIEKLEQQGGGVQYFTEKECSFF